jgi:diaminopimelate epimerase
LKIHFTKMHGLGNDFILLDCRQLELDNLPGLSKKLCHRRFGVGADQVLLLYNSNIADFKMRIFNADGSEVEMCGNGIRCLAKYIWDQKLSDKNILNIETLTGVIRPERTGNLVKVDMGKPIFEPEKIPVIPPNPSLEKGGWVDFKAGGKGRFEKEGPRRIIDYPLQVEDKEFKITCVSMGNPHAVIIVDELSDFPVSYYGPRLENHFMFPRRTNVEFIEVINPVKIKMRVWERGSGETMACGTGASAAVVASNIKGLAERKVTVHLLGGDLFIEWAGDNRVYMTGPAVEVFEGIIES